VAVADTGVPYRFEAYFPPLDKYFVISVAPLERGQFATIFFDITDRKRAEEALQALNHSLQDLNAQLQEALRAKDEMVQNVSHELRTPLTLIMGHLELLLSGVRGLLTAEQQYSLNVMETQSRRLYFMVNRLLMLRAIDTQGLNKTRLDPLSWLARLVEPWQIKAAMASIGLEVDLPPALPAIDADPDMLEQVIVNLLDNAFKFSPPQTTIRLGASTVVRNEAIPARHWLRLTVRDQGRGIPPDELKRVFERFYQVDGGLARRFGGMGIGLALKEEFVLKDGVPLVRSFKDYPIPRAKDMPEIVPIIVEAPSSEGPFGAKGIGEIPSIPTPPAIVNAIYRACGVRFYELPVKSHKLREMLCQKQT
jgi:signal transduction histidine kinase